MKKFIKGILFALIPVVIITVGILIISTSKTPSVREIPPVVHPGYQTEPAKYVVEASFAKYWHDSRIPLLIVLAYIVAIFGTTIVISADLDPKVSPWLIAAIWLTSVCCVFVPMAPKYGSSSYQSTLTVQEYETNKGNLDALFPSIESTPK